MDLNSSVDFSDTEKFVIESKIKRIKEQELEKRLEVMETEEFRGLLQKLRSKGVPITEETIICLTDYYVELDKKGKDLFTDIREDVICQHISQNTEQDFNYERADYTDIDRELPYTTY